MPNVTCGNETNSTSNKAGLRSSRQVFCKKGVLRNFAKLTGKHLYQSLFFNKVAGLWQTEIFCIIFYPHLYSKISKSKKVETFNLIEKCERSIKENAQFIFLSNPKNYRLMFAS